MAKEKLSDKHFMKLALKQAKMGLYTTSPNPAVGCVIVREGKVLGKGYHHRAGEPHAEIMAMNDATEKGHNLDGATAYVTLEPCSHYGRTPPCAKALCAANIKRVVIATVDPNPKVAGRGIAILKAAGIEVKVGVCKKKALELNRAFFYAITRGRPWVFVKYGMSLDAKLALENGESKWITNADARHDVQRLRLWADAIITSHATVKADNPRLNVRLNDLPFTVQKDLDPKLVRQPLRVVIDSHGSLCAKREQSLLEPYTMFHDGQNYIVVGYEGKLPPYSVQGVANKNAASHSKKVPRATSSGEITIPENPAAHLLAKAGITKGDEATASTTSTTSPEATAKDAKEAALAAALAEAERVTAAGREDEKMVEEEANSAFDKDSLGLTEVSTADATEALAAVSSKRKKVSAKKDSTTKVRAKDVSTTATKSKAKPKAKDAVASSGKAIAPAPKARALKGAAAKGKAAEPVVLVKPDPLAKVVAQGNGWRVEEYTEHVRLIFVPLVKDAAGVSHVSLESLMECLGALEVRVAMVEAGGALSSAFLERGIVNECYCYIAPMLLGQNAREAFVLPPLQCLPEAPSFSSLKVRQLDNNVCLQLSNFKAKFELPTLA